MKGHHIHARGWVAVIAILLLIAAHALLFGLASKLHYSVLLVGTVIGMAALKYGWWKLRR